MQKIESRKRSQYCFQGSNPLKQQCHILECILIDATTDVIKLTANDMELGIETTIDGIIDSRGIIALNDKDFSRNCPLNFQINDVVIETESDNQAIITCEKAKFNIAAQSGDEFFLSSGD